MKRMNGLLGLVAAAVVCVAMAAPANAEPVDLELSLVIDVSGSVNSTEYNLQMDGYGAAFRNAGIQSAILSTTGGKIGAIAVNAVFFGTGAVAPAATAWTKLSSLADINAWATTLENLSRPTGGSTNIGAGMNLSRGGFLGNAFDGTRLVMDVSGDGARNTGPSVAAARNAAALAGITVNGIVIGGGASLENYYNSNVRTPDGFVVAAANFADFEGAVTKKIGREVGNQNPVPEPGTYALFGLAAAGYAVIRRRRRNVA